MAMCESIEELIEFLQARADRCQKSREHVAAVGHRETIKHLENIVKEAKKEEIALYRIVFRSPSDGSINGMTEWMETKPPMPPSYGTVIQVSGTPIEAVYDEGETR